MPFGESGAQSLPDNSQASKARATFSKAHYKGQQLPHSLQSKLKDLALTLENSLHGGFPCAEKGAASPGAPSTPASIALAQAEVSHSPLKAGLEKKGLKI